MEDRFNISTLIHPAPRRAHLLDTCVRSVFAHVDIPWRVNWSIYCNGMSRELGDVIGQLQRDFKSRASIIGVYGEENQGLGYGINKCNELSEGFEYTLLLEGDWLCLHPDDSGQPRSWLVDALDALEQELDLDAVYLRRFYDDIDSRQTGLHSHYKKIVRLPRLMGGTRFFVSDFQSYTNNPLVRRNTQFFEKGIFPLFEPWQDGVSDGGFHPSDSPFAKRRPMEFKGNKEWGLCEIEAERMMKRGKIDLRMAVLNWGVCTHIENSEMNGEMRLVLKTNGCGDSSHGRSSCRWGYYRMAPHFCALCQRGFQVHELDKVFHGEGYFLRDLEKAKSNNGEGESVEEVVKRWNPDPTRPLSEISL